MKHTIKTLQLSTKRKLARKGACLQENLVYCATIKLHDEKYKPELYKGSCEISLKKHYIDHKT